MEAAETMTVPVLTGAGAVAGVDEAAGVVVAVALETVVEAMEEVEAGAGSCLVCLPLIQVCEVLTACLYLALAFSSFLSLSFSLSFSS